MGGKIDLWVEIWTYGSVGRDMNLWVEKWTCGYGDMDLWLEKWTCGWRYGPVGTDVYLWVEIRTCGYRYGPVGRDTDLCGGGLVPGPQVVRVEGEAAHQHLHHPSTHNHMLPSIQHSGSRSAPFHSYLVSRIRKWI